jgi:hypothetical protein
MPVNNVTVPIHSIGHSPQNRRARMSGRSSYQPQVTKAFNVVAKHRFEFELKRPQGSNVTADQINGFISNPGGGPSADVESTLRLDVQHVRDHLRRLART